MFDFNSESRSHPEITLQPTRFNSLDRHGISTRLYWLMVVADSFGVQYVGRQHISFLNIIMKHHIDLKILKQNVIW